MNVQLKKIIKQSIPLLKKNDVVKASIFGSVARGAEKKRSDVDFLVKFKGRKSLLDLVRLKHQLEDTLHRHVDVLTYKSVHPPLKKYILKDEVRIV
ncbi:MAG TPA: nucleotidyltransferase family protein [Candidatus Nanoarchaeia archaeon]|nr:nucleotidyltransferase family protein [Candidatus Nanoarchaeia archaeon]